jgi:hypothetical protein
MSKKINREAGFAHLVPVLIAVLVVTAGIGAGVRVHSHQVHSKQVAAQEAAAAASKLAFDQSAKSSAAAETPANSTPTPATPAPTTTPTPAPTKTTSTPAKSAPTPAPTPKPTPAPTPTPSLPTSVDLAKSNLSSDRVPHSCSTSFGRIFAIKSPTYSYSSPNGSQLNSYPQWTIIEGLSCASVTGWVQSGNEYFYGLDLLNS